MHIYFTMLDYYIFIVIRAVIENCGSCGLQYVIADIFTCAEQIDAELHLCSLYFGRFTVDGVIQKLKSGCFLRHSVVNDGWCVYCVQV